jgi:hypothetical protein
MPSGAKIAAKASTESRSHRALVDPHRYDSDRRLEHAALRRMFRMGVLGKWRVEKAVSYGKRCLNLRSGWTSWKLRLLPECQRILSDARVQAFSREFRTP